MREPQRPANHEVHDTLCALRATSAKSRSGCWNQWKNLVVSLTPDRIKLARSLTLSFSCLPTHPASPMLSFHSPVILLHHTPLMLYTFST